MTERYRTDEGAERISDRVLSGVRDTFAGVGVVKPHALVFSTADIKTGKQLVGGFGAYYLVADFDDPAGKDRFSAALRATCFAMDAFGVAFVTEGYINQGDTAEERARSGASLKSMHGTREAVVVTLEHCAYRVARAWIAFIEREVPGDEASPGTLGDWEAWDDATGYSGRFANLLPGAGGN